VEGNGAEVAARLLWSLRPLSEKHIRTYNYRPLHLRNISVICLVQNSPAKVLPSDGILRSNWHQSQSTRLEEHFRQSISCCSRLRSWLTPSRSECLDHVVPRFQDLADRRGYESGTQQMALETIFWGYNVRRRQTGLIEWRCCGCISSNPLGIDLV